MAKFTDKLQREWRLDITVADLKPLREVGFTFTAFLPDNAGQVLFDPERLVAVVHVMAHVPADVTADDFARGFDGPALQRAGEAVLEAVADFSPHCRLAEWMRGRFAEVLTRMAEAAVNSLASRPSPSNSPAGSAASPPPPSAA